MKRICCLLLLVSSRAWAQDCVNVVGEFVLESPSNCAGIEIGATSVKPTSDSALHEVQRAIRKLITISEEHGVDSSEMSIRQMQVQKREERIRGNEGYVTKFLGYEATVTYRILLTRIKSVEPFTNACLHAGINKLISLTYTHSRKDSLERAAYRNALRDATAHAEALCQEEGRKLGRLLKASYEKPDGFHVYLHECRDRNWRRAFGKGGSGKRSETIIPMIPAPLRITAKVFASFEIK